MNRCQTCAYYSAIDPSAGNCRVNGAGRQTLKAALPAGSCALHQVVANDNPSRVVAA